MRGKLFWLFAGPLMAGFVMMLAGDSAPARAESESRVCGNATFNVYGIEVENKGVESVLVLKYDLLSSDIARCVTPEKYPLIIPRKKVFCERDIKGVCGMSSPLFKSWSYDAFPG